MDFSKYVNNLTYFSKRMDADKFKAYRDEDARLLELFKNDLFEDLGIENNDKRDMLFSIAMDFGHSSGYRSVYDYACDIVCLIE